MSNEHCHITNCISLNKVDGLKDLFTSEIDLFYDDGIFWRLAISDKNEFIFEFLLEEYKNREGLFLCDIQKLHWRYKLRTCIEDAMDQYLSYESKIVFRESFKKYISLCSGSCFTDTHHDAETEVCAQGSAPNT